MPQTAICGQRRDSERVLQHAASRKLWCLPPRVCTNIKKKNNIWSDAKTHALFISYCILLSKLSAHKTRNFSLFLFCLWSSLNKYSFDSFFKCFARVLKCFYFFLLSSLFSQLPLFSAFVLTDGYTRRCSVFVFVKEKKKHRNKISRKVNCEKVFCGQVCHQSGRNYCVAKRGSDEMHMQIKEKLFSSLS